MDTINHTEITEERSEVKISGDGGTVEESNEIINIAAVELRKVEEVAAAQAEAIARKRGGEPMGKAADYASEEASKAADQVTAEELMELAVGREAETAVISVADTVVTETTVTAETETAAVTETTVTTETETAIVTETAVTSEAETKVVTETAVTTETETVIATETAVTIKTDGATAAESEEPAEEETEEEAVSVEKPSNVDSDNTVHVIGVRFKTAGKVYYFDPGEWEVRHGVHVIVETVRGIEYGTVVGFPMDVKESKVTQPLKEVIRVATPEDDETERRNRAKEKEAYRICQEKIQAHGLEMKLISAEYTFDNSKVLFYFTADGRVDFRDLVKDLASVFRTRIELRQIGVRDETKILGGYGICGRPLCCHTWMNDFIPVSIKMAKEQNLSLNPGKISGVCGRLMCCLKNEADTYEELNRNLPKVGDEVQGSDGLSGQVESVNVLRQTVRILVEVDDEKEYHEYHVDDLTIIRRRRRGGNRGRKDNLDAKEAQELEKLESQERQSQGTRDRGDRQERGDRSNRGNRQNRGDNQGRADRQDRSDNQGRGDRQERGDYQDRGDRPNRGNRQNRGDYQGRGDRQDRGDRSDSQNRGDNQGRGDGQNRGDRQDRGNRRYNKRRNQNNQGGGQGQNGSNAGTSD